MEGRRVARLRARGFPGAPVRHGLTGVPMRRHGRGHGRGHVSRSSHARGVTRPDRWENEFVRVRVACRDAAVVLEEDISRTAGFYHGLRGQMFDDRALALIERTPYFWLAVGLVAGALMRQKTLDGFEVEALVRAARENDST